MLRLASRLSASILISTLIILSSPLSTPARAAEPPTIDWVQGPATVDLGDIARIKLGKDYIFANAKDAQAMLKYLGEPYDESDLGVVGSNDETEGWVIWFTYNPIGYVKDDEKNSLDAAKILESIRKGTEEGNKTRVKNGASALKVIGWSEEPHYDSLTNNLTWVLLLEEVNTGTPLVNYNTRLLGRYGYMAIIMVTEPKTLQSDRIHAANVIANYSWKSGKSYAEWRSGDKVAEIGLTALVAGGAGAVAAKTGLLAKLWKFIVAGAVAVGGVIVKFFNKLRGKRTTPSSDIKTG